jgi:protein-S-isoprenylcysteine O-methyltransferase Ste14
LASARAYIKHVKRLELETQDEYLTTLKTNRATQSSMVSRFWVATLIVIIVAAILPYLKKKTKNNNYRKQDVFFQVSGLILLIAILIVSFGNLDYPMFSIQSPMNIVGAIMFIIGLIISISAQVTINTNYSWTLEIREGHTLVENGLYKYVRHPIYLGTFIRVIAIPIYMSSFYGFLLGLLSIPLFAYRISLEERMLVEEFGEEYKQYQKHTWKLFPFIY